MKPREETLKESWSAFDADPAGLAIEGGRIADFTGPDGYSRAKLAAQAPAMARLLLSELRNDPVGFKEGLDQIRSVLRAAGVIP